MDWMICWVKFFKNDTENIQRTAQFAQIHYTLHYTAQQTIQAVQNRKRKIQIMNNILQSLRNGSWHSKNIRQQTENIKRNAAYTKSKGIMQKNYKK